MSTGIVTVCIRLACDTLAVASIHLIIHWLRPSDGKKDTEKKPYISYHLHVQRIASGTLFRLRCDCIDYNPFLYQVFGCQEPSQLMIGFKIVVVRKLERGKS
ncbi:MAG TPA: hypothetical protein DCE42_22940 [Myxococcales bacterium]|nr:hypothetical protein [Deltaproteobacteria bacterium]MBU47226.1 hypothetical protein [Deltaproteobacteria bacterium]HAA57642.1 hypothetical protein [Myxococcales bacterium]